MGPFDHLEVLVEEASMEAVLQQILPQVTEGTTFQVYPHNGKAGLLGKLSQRLRGYAQWLPDSYGILVVADVDNDDCRALKARIQRDAEGATLQNRVLIRLAVEELEAWFFGDWEAVRAAYPRVNANVPNRAAFRNPDGIQGGTWEALEREMQRSGYYLGGLPKIEFARRVAKYMDISRNRSRSLQILCEGVRRITRRPG